MFSRCTSVWLCARGKKAKEQKRKGKNWREVQGHGSQEEVVSATKGKEVGAGLLWTFIDKIFPILKYVFYAIHM